MNAYEKYRTELLDKLSFEFEDNQLLKIRKVIDDLARYYKFDFADTDIVVYDETSQPILDYYVACKKLEGLSDKTLQAYAMTLRMFFARVGKPPEEVTTNDVRMWLYTYSEAHSIAPQTQEKYRECISRFFKWAVDEGYASINPCLRVHQIKSTYKQRTALTPKQFKIFRKHATCKRDIAMIDFMLSTGCRVSEVTNVKISDINFDQKKLKVLGKGNKERFVYLSADAEVSIEDYLAERDDDEPYLFVSLRNPRHQLSKEAIEKTIRHISHDSNIGVDVTPHIIRHTTATMMINNGADIGSVSKILGHSDPATTMIYAEIADTTLHTLHTKCFS